MFVINRYPEFRDFLHYVRNTYVLPTAIFRPAVWNVYQRNMDNRTNNKVESNYDTFFLLEPVKFWESLLVLNF